MADMVNDPHMRNQIEKEKADAITAKSASEKYETLLADSREGLYPGCDPEVTRLSFSLELLRIKAANNSTDKSLDDQLAYLCKIMPKDHKLPQSCNEAKKIVCPLGLEVQRYHACRNDCMIYRGKDANLKNCPVCKESQYKRGREEIGRASCRERV